MRELVRKYIKGEIKNSLQLMNLRDNPNFMIEVFRAKMVASEFDNASGRLKNDPVFIQKTKDVFACNQAEYFSLCISLRNWRKQREKLQEQAKQEAMKEAESREDVAEETKEETKKVPVEKTEEKPIKEIKETPKEEIKEEHVEVPKKVPVEKPKKEPKKAPASSPKKEKNKKLVEVPIEVEVEEPKDEHVDEVKEEPTEECVEEVTEKRNEDLVQDTNNEDFDDEVLLFEKLVNKLPIDDYARLYIVYKFKEASKASRVVALAMVSDYINYRNQPKPIGLMKIKRNNFNKF